MSEPPPPDAVVIQPEDEVGHADLEAALGVIEIANHRASAARAWAVVLMNDLSWLIGAASQAGIEVPGRIGEDLQEAVSWIASE